MADQKVHTLLNKLNQKIAINHPAIGEKIDQLSNTHRDELIAKICTISN